MALEDRSQGYADLVSNSNALLYLMKKQGQMKKFSGPTIRERLLYNESGTYTRYSGYQYLNPKPAELFAMRNLRRALLLYPSPFPVRIF